MKHIQKKPGNARTSRIAACITIAILLCLLFAGGLFVMFRTSPAENSSDKDSESPESEASSVSFADSTLEWLGIDTILSILDIGDGYTVVKADPSIFADSASDPAGTVPPADGVNPPDSAADHANAGSKQPAGGEPPESADVSVADQASPESQNTSAEAKNNQSGQDASAADKTAQAAADPSAANSSSPAESAEKKSDQKAEKEKEEKKDKSPTKLQKKYIQAWEDWHMRDFPNNFPLHNYNWKYLSYDESGILRYEGDDDYMIRRGIDVSEFQGKIDWDRVKEAGYSFAFVRVGHRTMHTGDLQRDSRAIKNLTRAKKAGLDVGAYVFSQAITKKEAREEAKLCLDVIEDSGVELTLPIVYDPEIVVEDYYARINYISGEQFTDNAVAFCETIKKAGYTPAIYANSSTETDILDMSRLKGTTIWYADYSGIPETPYDFTFWQYSDLGWVDGIPETETDLNVWFIKK